MSSPSSRLIVPVPLTVPDTVKVSLPVVPWYVPSTVIVAPEDTTVVCGSTTVPAAMYSVPPCTSTVSNCEVTGPLMLSVPTLDLIRVSKLTAPPRAAVVAMSAVSVSMPRPPSIEVVRPLRSAPSCSVN
ncbi:hypothetical protein D3C87_1638420 [compost metagenome]